MNPIENEAVVSSVVCESDFAVSLTTLETSADEEFKSSPGWFTLFECSFVNIFFTRF